MSWDYRVVRVRDKNTPWTCYRIWAVYYNKRGKPNGWSGEGGFIPGGDTIKDLRWDLSAMLGALDKPILEEKDGKLVEITQEDGQCST